MRVEDFAEGLRHFGKLSRFGIRGVEVGVRSVGKSNALRVEIFLLFAFELFGVGGDGVEIIMRGDGEVIAHGDGDAFFTFDVLFASARKRGDFRFRARNEGSKENGRRFCGFENTIELNILYERGDVARICGDGISTIFFELFDKVRFSNSKSSVEFWRVFALSGIAESSNFGSVL